MKKLILCTLLLLGIRGYSQETNTYRPPNLREETISKRIIRTDSHGTVVWEKTLESLLSDNEEGAYIFATKTKIINGRITGNPYDYDYWLIEDEEREDINVMPTICTEFTNVFITSNSNKDYYCDVYNSLGRKIYMKTLEYGDNILLFRNFQPGAYYIRIRTRQYIIKTFKIIITK